MFLYGLGGTHAFDAQDGIGRVGAIRAASALPVATGEGDIADSARQLSLFRPTVFLLASARTDADRRPLFSAVSMRRATASPRTWPCSFRPFSTTVSSQASKTAPSGAERASCSISSAIAKARRTIASCCASNSIETLLFIEHPVRVMGFQRQLP